MRRPPPPISVHCALDRPYARLDPIDHEGRVGELEGHDVRLHDANGTLVGERPSARAFFSTPRHVVRWDTLDLTYFLGYVCWNYLGLPAHLLREEFGWTEPEPGVLETNVQPHLPVHTRVQRYWFDRESGLQTRLDFTAEVMAHHAHASTRIRGHERSDGVVYVSEHWVTPRKGKRGGPLPRPTVLLIRVSDLKLL